MIMSGSEYTTTPNLGLYKPLYNADAEQWGNHLNLNADILDDAISGVGINIKDHGAVCDGVTDDSAALLAAIAAALAKPTGGNVLIPAGKVALGSAISVTVPSDKMLTIEGVGCYASRLLFTGATNGLDITLDQSGGKWGSVSLHGFAVLRVPTSPVSANAGIRISAVSATSMCNGAVILRDLLVGGVGAPTARVSQWANSVVLTGPNGAVIENVAIAAPDGGSTDAGDVLLSLVGGASSAQYATSFNVLNCGFNGGSTGIGVTGWVQGVLVSNSTVVGQYDSIRWLDGAAHLAEELGIVNCSLNARHRGVYAEGVNSSGISNNTILHFALSATDFSGIEMKSTYLTSVMANNVVGANAGGEDGILLTDSSKSVVMGNALANLNGYGIYFKGTTATCSAIGNVIDGGAPIFQETNGNTLLVNTHNGLALLPPNAANDAAAATAGVGIGGEYRNGSVKMVRVA
jgi:polygalacturonase